MGTTCCYLFAVYSAREQNQVLKEVHREKSLDDLYYDTFSGEFVISRQ